MYNKPTESTIKELCCIVGEEHVINDFFLLENYGHDETPGYCSLPEVVVKPVNTDQVSKLMKLANKNMIPVTPRGGGTSLSAGAVPVHGGIVMSFERMSRIKEIDTTNLMAVVEPGVITGDLEKELDRHELFFPPDPVSMDSCTVGGNIAECAGGPRAMKYGVTKNYVTGLEVVMADGAVTTLGGKLIKNVTGYDLIDLIVGSEGTLAIVTEATLRLLPKPREIADLLIPFKRIDDAASFALATVNRGFQPAVIEYIGGSVIHAVSRYLNRYVRFQGAEAQIIVRLDGNDRSTITADYNKIGDLAMKHGAIDVLVAESVKDRESMWELRKKTGEALKAQCRIVAREDLVVPKIRIPDLVKELTECAAGYKCTLYAFGHLGDGNIHADFGLMPDCEIKNEQVGDLRREIYRITVGLGGTITAEHGIGLSKIEYLPLALSPLTIEKMRQIKKVFDPNNILNPGKIFAR